jgi:16S rRNA (guanine(966)-N(2))-methyltransferase RsmD
LPELLRVSGGEARGRRLKTPRGIRPTQGLVKEAIFNMVGPAVVDGVVIDLFAGSGALGIEALSRGAARAVFVERDESSAAILRQNLEALGFRDRARTARADAVRWLEAHPEVVREATVVLLDPPYGDPILGRALKALDGFVGDDALVVAEHAAGERLPDLTRLTERRQRRYGDTEVTILEAAPGSPGNRGGRVRISRGWS